MLATVEFKSSSDFREVVENAASKYFGEGFDFCKRQLAVHYPNLSIDLDAMDMDHELLEKEEREAEEKEEVWEDEQEPHICRLRIISALFLLNFVKHL